MDALPAHGTSMTIVAALLHGRSVLDDPAQLPLRGRAALVRGLLEELDRIVPCATAVVTLGVTEQLADELRQLSRLILESAAIIGARHRNPCSGSVRRALLPPGRELAGGVIAPHAPVDARSIGAKCAVWSDPHDELLVVVMDGLHVLHARVPR
jgi:hypothetical protein